MIKMATLVNKSQRVIKFEDNILIPNKPVEVGNINNAKKKYPALSEMLNKKYLVEVRKNQSINLAGEKIETEKNASEGDLSSDLTPDEK